MTLKIYEYEFEVLNIDYKNCDIECKPLNDKSKEWAKRYHSSIICNFYGHSRYYKRKLNDGPIITYKYDREFKDRDKYRGIPILKVVKASIINPDLRLVGLYVNQIIDDGNKFKMLFDFITEPDTRKVIAGLFPNVKYI